MPANFGVIQLVRPVENIKYYFYNKMDEKKKKKKGKEINEANLFFTVHPEPCTGTEYKPELL